MKKIISFIKEKKGYFLSFFLPFLSLILLFILLRVFYFNKYTALISDMQAQYFSLFHYLKELLQGGHTLSYSFNNGLGGGMIGVIGYYLMSPLNLLVLLFSDARFHYAILIISFLKISLSGSSMFFYLKKHYPDKKDLYLLIFSTSYALMSYNICYYFNVLWLDSLYLLPLMCYGIDQLIHKKKSLLYGISLMMSIFCNYYIGYMMCIFSVLYFGYSILTEYSWKKDKKKMLEATLLYGFTSLFAGLSTMVILVPSLLNVMNSSKSISEAYSLSLQFMPVPELFSRMYIGSQSATNILCHGGPMIYVGMSMLVLFFLYFFNRKISKKEKWLSLIVLLIFFLSFDINYLNYVWHGFNLPIGFDHRFTFLFNFFVLILCARTFFHREGNQKLHYWMIASIFPFFSIWMTFQSFEYLGIECIYISVALYLFYLILLYAFSLIKEKRQETLLSYLLFFLVFCELFFNSYICLKDYSFAPRKENYDYMTVMDDHIKKWVPKENQFYRMEKDFKYTQLDSFLYDYYGVSSFLSTIPDSTIQFWKHVGYNEYINAIIYTSGFPPIIDSMLGMKYFIYNAHDFEYGKELDRFSFSKYGGDFHNMFLTDYIVYENPYALGLGYMISNQYQEYDKLNKDIFPSLSVQNYIWSAMLHSDENVLTASLSKEIDENTYQFVLHTDETVYFDFLATKGGEYQTKQIFINDQLYFQFSDNAFTGFRIKKGTFQKGDIITIKIKYEKNDVHTSNLIVYEFNEELFAKQVQQLREHELQLKHFKDGSIKGTVVATEEMPILFLSIPNEDGWVAKVDGKKEDIKTVYDTFMGLELTPGEHQIELEYHIPGFRTSLIVSLFAIVLWILFYWKRNPIIKMISNLYFDHEEIWNYLIVGGLTTVINVVFYAGFTKVLHIDYMISTVIAWIVAVLFAYVANKIVVFKTKLHTKKELLKECFDFFKFRILSLFLEIGCMYFFVTMIHFNDIISKVIVNILVIVANYFFSKLFIFKKKIEKIEG